MDRKDKLRIRVQKCRRMKKFKLEYAREIKNSQLNDINIGNRPSCSGTSAQHNLYVDDNSNDNYSNCSDSTNSEYSDSSTSEIENEPAENIQNNIVGDNDDLHNDAHEDYLRHCAQAKEIAELRSWAIESRIPLVHLDKLLNILRQNLLPSLPQSSVTFLKTNSSAYKISEMEDCDGTRGEYVYFGLERGLSYVNNEIHSTNMLELQVNIDGVKLFKSSIKSMWPILAKIRFDPDIYKPFVVAAYIGNSKPKSVNEFLKDFIRDINSLQNTGVVINENQFRVKLQCFICDTPARSYLKCTKGHNSQHGCERCLVKRQTINKIPTYVDINCTKRSDKSFRQFSDVEHHSTASPLLFIEPHINMIDDFPLDSMHLCDLGVMKRLIDSWMSSDQKERISDLQKKVLSSRMEKLGSQQPIEFQRKIRSIQHHCKFKATEYRFILLFVGPVILKGILSDKKYKHFLLLHVACRMLSSKNALEYADYAEKLLKKFITRAKKLYGPQFVVMNVHSLQHLSDDVRNQQCALSSIDAYTFENKLGEITNIIRSPHNILAQLARRLHEIDLHCNQRPSLPSMLILRQNSEGIQKLKYAMMTITTKPPDNLFLLQNNKICLVKKCC